MAMDDAKAFTALYNKYWKFLFSITCQKLDNAAEAEELVQDIFLDLWQRRATLQLTASLSSYLSVTVNYKVLKVLAKRQLHAKYAASGWADGATASYQMETMLDFETVKGRLLHLVAALPKKCRLVFRMSREQAMTGREIAQQLRISEKTVESHMTRALQQLKTGLELLPFILLLTHF